MKATTQPFASFGGRAEETATELATRASERLRHKDRASTMWDHERLVLEAFPSLDQVRCLNHTRYGPDEHGIVVYDELAPGHVTVVTIPDQQHQNRLDPLRPATSLGLLAEIEDLLRARMSCFAELHVRNPQFEEVWVDFRVRFRRGTDETFHRKLLQTEITRFLSPWAFPADPGSAGLGPGAADLRRSEPGSGGLETRPSFNGRVRKSVVLNFVEERTYVDYVADFTLHHRYLARTAAGAVETRTNHDVDEAVPSRAVSILVSVPASVHRVDPIHHDTTTAARESCPCEPRDAP